MFHLKSLSFDIYLLLYLNVINPNLAIIQLKLLEMVLGNMICVLLW